METQEKTPKSMTNEELIGACVTLDREQKKSRAMLNGYKAELQARGLALMEDHNVKYVKFYGGEGSAAITDSMSLDILNPDKLKGEFEKDKETLISVLVPEGQEAPDFDVELWYIYRIKNGELIRAFLPEEMLDSTIESIRKSILVETKTSITLDYDTEKEE